MQDQRRLKKNAEDQFDKVDAVVRQKTERLRKEKSQYNLKLTPLSKEMVSLQ